MDKDAYDNCKLDRTRRMLTHDFNCSLPWADIANVSYCKGDTIVKARYLYETSMIYLKDEECPVPCINLYASFGFPFISKTGNDVGRLRMYFKSIVKVTEDYVSYDFLR